MVNELLERTQKRVKRKTARILQSCGKGRTHMKKQTVIQNDVWLTGEKSCCREAKGNLKMRGYRHCAKYFYISYLSFTVALGSRQQSKSEIFRYAFKFGNWERAGAAETRTLRKFPSQPFTVNWN